MSQPCQRFFWQVADAKNLVVSKGHAVEIRMPPGLPLQRLTGGGAFQPHPFGPIVDVRGG
jgi:hypothetical protein